MRASPRSSAAFEAMGLKPGDHLVTALQNNWQAATIHWACQFTGIDHHAAELALPPPTNWTIASTMPTPAR